MCLNISNFVEKAPSEKCLSSTLHSWKITMNSLDVSFQKYSSYAAVSITSFFITQMVAYSLPTAYCSVLCLLFTSLPLLWTAHRSMVPFSTTM